MSSVARKRWYHIQWFADEDTPEERKFLIKLDLLIVPYAVLSYFVKYLDQGNLNNAYVAGMKEDLGFYGNQLVQLQTMYVVGAVVGQLPFLFLFTYIPMHWIIPFMDIAWGIFTLLQYRTQSFAELAAYRFLVGWFEAAYFPAMHYVFGAWYRGDEIARRGGIFYIGLGLGTLTAGLIQAGASARLEGVHGLAGWRWMYIICALITIPVGIVGYFVVPGTHEQPNRRFLNDRDLDISRRRLERSGHVLHGKVQWNTVKTIVLSGKFWSIVAIDVLFWNAGTSASTGSFLLWLKSLNRYSLPHVNNLGATAPALGMFYTLFACFLSDLVTGPAWAITIAQGWNAVGLVIKTIWHVPEAALWVGFLTSYASSAMSSVLHGWVNAQLKAAPAERAFTLVLINMIAQSSTAWTPLLVFPTVESPRFPKGFPFCLACALLLILSSHVLDFSLKRKERLAKEAEHSPSSPSVLEGGLTGEHEVDSKDSISSQAVPMKITST